MGRACTQRDYNKVRGVLYVQGGAPKRERFKGWSAPSSDALGSLVNGVVEGQTGSVALDSLARIFTWWQAWCSAKIIGARGGRTGRLGVSGWREEDF